MEKSGISAQIVNVDSRAQDKGALLEQRKTTRSVFTHNVILKVLLMKVAIVSNDKCYFSIRLYKQSLCSLK